MTRSLHLCHALVFIHGHKLVAHAMNQENGHGQLSVVDLISLRPVLTAHHGSQDKRRHVEGIALFQQLLFFGALASKPSSRRKKKRGWIRGNGPECNLRT